MRDPGRSCYGLRDEDGAWGGGVKQISEWFGGTTKGAGDELGRSLSGLAVLQKGAGDGFQ